MELKLLGEIIHTLKKPEPFETAKWYGISDAIRIIENRIQELTNKGKYRLSNTITVEINKTYTSLQVFKTGTMTGTKDILLTISKSSNMKDIEQKRIKLADLVPASFNNREHYSDAELKDLTASVKAKGIQASLIVRPHPSKPGKYEIIGGFRRHKAGTAAGVVDAPCNVKEMTDDEAYEIMIIDNLHREDIHPLDEANSFTRMSDKHTAEQIAGMIHKSKSYVLKRMKLSDLVPDAQRMFYEGKMTYVQAIQIARLTRADQERVLRDCMATRHLDGGRTEKYLQSEQEIRSYISDKISLELGTSPFDLEDATLVVTAGACSICPKRTRNQPDLFDTATKTDRCMDPSCYKSKVNAHVNAAVKKHEGKHDQVLRGSIVSWQKDSVQIGGASVPTVSKKDVPDAIPVVLSGVKYGGAQDKKRLGVTVYVSPDFKKPAEKADKATKQNTKAQELQKAADLKCSAFREYLFLKIFAKITFKATSKYMIFEFPECLYERFLNDMDGYNDLDNWKGIVAFAFGLQGFTKELRKLKGESGDWGDLYVDSKHEKPLYKEMYKLPVSNSYALVLAAAEAMGDEDVTKSTDLWKLATALRLDPDGLKKTFSKEYDLEQGDKDDAKQKPGLKASAIKGKGKGLAALLTDAKKSVAEKKVVLTGNGRIVKKKAAAAK